MSDNQEGVKQILRHVDRAEITRKVVLVWEEHHFKAQNIKSHY